MAVAIWLAGCYILSSPGAWDFIRPQGVLFTSSQAATISTSEELKVTGWSKVCGTEYVKDNDEWDDIKRKHVLYDIFSDLIFKSQTSDARDEENNIILSTCNLSFN